MIERDDRFPPDPVLNAELDAVAAVLARHRCSAMPARKAA
jgi:hypothetical protein